MSKKKYVRGSNGVLYIHQDGHLAGSVAGSAGNTPKSVSAELPQPPAQRMGTPLETVEEPGSTTAHCETFERFQQKSKPTLVTVNRTWGGFPQIPDSVLEEHGCTWEDTFDSEFRNQPWLKEYFSGHEDVETVELPPGAHHRIFDNDGNESVIWSMSELDTGKRTPEREWRTNPDPTMDYVAVNATYGGFHIPDKVVRDHGYDPLEVGYRLEGLRSEPWVLEYADVDDDMAVVKVPRGSHRLMTEYDGVEVIYHSDSPIESV